MRLTWNKKQKDFVIRYNKKGDDILVLNHILGDILRFDLSKYGTEIPYTSFNFKDELEKRGYDLTTLKFSIDLKLLNKQD